MTAIWSINKSSRNIQLAARNSSPGPGAYTPRAYDKEPIPAWTMHGLKNRNIYTISQFPGPGAYELKSRVFKQVKARWKDLNVN